MKRIRIILATLMSVTLGVVSSLGIFVGSAAADTPPPSGPQLTTPATLTNQRPVLVWSNVDWATHYNIYRSAPWMPDPNFTNIATVSAGTTTFTDTTTTSVPNYYYVTAADDTVESQHSNSIKINYDFVPPTITYSLSPTPNDNGWSNSPVTVAFACSDNIYYNGGPAIAACSAPVTVSTDGQGRAVTGNATDMASNTASVTATVNLDQTAPVLSKPRASQPVVLFGGGDDTISATATDNLSGTVAGEWFTDTDPGQGNGTPMTYASGKISANVTLPTTRGSYTYSMRSRDAAGNWSNVSTVTIRVLL